MTLELVKVFLLDMDGTLYLGDSLFDGVKETLKLIRESGGKIVFLTNNSSKSEDSYREKLERMGIFDSRDIIYTSGMATVEYLNQNFLRKSVYLVGTKALEREFIAGGITLTDEKPDIVVLGYDTELTYEKLVKLTKFIVKGSMFIATHPDVNCPSEDVMKPDVGSFLALIEASTKIKPSVICGKPYTIMGDGLEKKFGLKKENFVMVGDRLSTDIKFAINNGFKSVLVLSGETTVEEYNAGSIKADLVLKSLNDIREKL